MNPKKEKSTSNQLSLFDLFFNNQTELNNENTSSDNKGNIRNQSDQPSSRDIGNGGNNSDIIQPTVDLTTSAIGQHEIGGNTAELSKSTYGSLSQQNGSQISTSISNRENDSTRSNTIGSPSGSSIQRPTRLKNYSFSYDPNLNETLKSFSKPQAYTRNIEAFKALVRVSNGEPLTTDLQEKIAAYSGFGGLKEILLDPTDQNPVTWDGIPAITKARVTEIHDLIKTLANGDQQYIEKYIDGLKRTILSAHFTPDAISSAIYEIILKTGFKGGKILDPASGTGRFISIAPSQIASNSSFTAIEIDPITGLLLQKILPDANVQIQPFERSILPQDHYDLIITNVPFSKIPIYDPTLTRYQDKRFEKAASNLHNFFIAKSILLAKPGGLLAFVTSRFTLDSHQNSEIREIIGDYCNLVTALRLPESAFITEAGTEVVTDILILQKRDKPIMFNQDNPLLHVYDYELTDVNKTTSTALINGYFLKNPHHVLGKHAFSSGMFKENNYTVVADTNDLHVLHQQIVSIGTESIQEPLYQSTTIASSIKLEEDLRRKFAISDFDSIGNLVQFPDGYVGRITADLYKEVGEGGIENIFRYVDPVTIRKEDARKVGLLIKIRQGLKQVIYYESNGYADETIDPIRSQLKKDYNQFIKLFGRIQSPGNSKLLKLDAADTYLISSIEKVDPQTKQITASDILFQRTITPSAQVLTAVDNLEDAITLSINQFGTLRMEYIADLLNSSVQDVMNTQQDEKALIFLTPEGFYQTRDEYLSGNVVEKLSVATSYAQEDSRFQIHVKALKSVQPKPIAAQDIYSPIHARWIPKEHIEAFLSHLSKSDGGRIGISYSKSADEYHINFFPNNEHVSIFQTKHRSPVWIIEHVLNGVEPIVKIQQKDAVFIDQEDTLLAKEHFRKIQGLWDDFKFQDYNRRTELEKIYNTRFNNSVLRDFTGSGQKMIFPGLIGFVPMPHQKDCVFRMLQNRGGLGDHIVGAGKAQPFFSKILTPTGWKKMGDIQINDEVISVDGKSTKVIGVYPQGKKEIFEIVFSDGSKTHCCEEHLWLTQNYAERCYQGMNKQNKDWDCSKPKVRTTKEIMLSLIAPHLNAKNHSIPLVTQPVEFTKQDVPIDPYLCGVLIGDGSLKHVPILSCNDPFIVQSIEKVLPENVKVYKLKTKRCDTYSFPMIDKKCKKNGINNNPLTRIVCSLGINQKSDKKRVPQNYLYNSTEVRIAILRGLMDTDGYANSKGTSSEFTTISKGLAEDVIFLVQSLGGIAHLRIKNGGYRKNGIRILTAITYTVTLCMPPNINPFLLPRKANLVKPKTKYKPRRYITSINSIGFHEAQCIAVDHESHLYLTDDFIVTHNTLVQVMTSYELRRLKLANKPMIIGIKAQVPDLYAAYKKAYPFAKILFPTEKDFEAKNRKKLLSSIATNDWDCIILTHDQFAKIPQNAKAVEKIYKEFLEQLSDEISMSSDRQDKKRLEARKYKYEQKLAKLGDISKDNDILDFTQLGVDFLMVDESHQFKNLEFTSRLRNVHGLGNQEGSKRAFNLLMAIRHLQDLHRGDYGVAFFSGTPISNSISELYLIQKYLTPSKLKERGIDSFDQWASIFASIYSDLEYYLGQYKVVNRIREFKNLPELITMYREFADVRNDSNLVIDKPKGRHTLVKIQPSSQQLRYIEMLFHFVQSKGHDYRNELGLTAGYDSKTGKNNSAQLLAINMAKKLSLDPRMISPALDSGTKIGEVARNVFNIYQNTAHFNGTQLIFCDMSTPKSNNTMDNLYDLFEGDQPLEIGIRSITEHERNTIFGQDYYDSSPKPTLATVKNRLIDILDITESQFNLCVQFANENNSGFVAYETIKTELIRMGVPADEIAFIHDYNSRTQREKLYSKINDGQIRITLGSTPKLGVGTNVQYRLAALHHVDINWRPSDLGQRNGRAERQGNWAAKVHCDNTVDIFYYATERTFDSYMYNLNGIKTRFIEQVKTDKVTLREVKDINEEIDLSAMGAELSGNPLVKEKASLDRRVTELSALKKSHLAQKYSAQESIRRTERSLDYAKNSVDKYERLIRHVDQLPKDSESGSPIIPFVVNGNTYIKPGEAGKALLDHQARLCRKALADVNGRGISEVSHDFVPIGEVAGYKIMARIDNVISIEYYIKDTETDQKIGPLKTLSSSESGAAISIRNIICGGGELLTQVKESIETHTQSLKNASALLEQNFDKEEELTAAKTRLFEINKLIHDELTKKKENTVNEDVVVYNTSVMRI